MAGRATVERPPVGRRGGLRGRLAALWRLLARARRHPAYALRVLGVALAHPGLALDALRHGWRTALLRCCAGLQPEVARLLTPYEAGFFGQVFLFDEYEVARLPLPRAPVVLDVGANVGLFTWRVQACRPGATILAFEPADENYRRLRTLFAALRVKGGALRRACGGEAGTATLFLRNSVTHSLDPGWHRDLDRGAGSETVEVVTVDGACDEAAITDVDLLKVDVEGAELQVLQGAAGTLRRTRHVVLEYHSEDLRAACRALLEGEGFHCRDKRFWGVHAQAGGAAEGLLLCSRPAPRARATADA